jgi:hypothetical protein
VRVQQGMVTDLEEAGVVEEEALLGVQQQVLLPVPVAHRRLHRGLERRLERRKASAALRDSSLGFGLFGCASNVWGAGAFVVLVE